MNRLKGIIKLPLLAFSLSFLLGILFASLLGLKTWIWLLLAGVVVILGWLIRRLHNFEIFSNQYSRMALIVLIGIFLGAARYQAAWPEITPTDAAWYNDQPDTVALVGVIIRPPDVRETHVQVVIAAEEIVVEGVPYPVEGRVLAYLNTAESWAYGDRVRVWGMLQTPPVHEDFSYQDYLARQRIYGYMPYTSAEIVDQDNGNRLLASLYRFKQTGLDLIYSYLPDPEASFASRCRGGGACFSG